MKRRMLCLLLMLALAASLALLPAQAANPYAAYAGAVRAAMAENGEKADVLFMDPPRAGSSPAFLQSTLTLSPKKIVYISCNPETQARDLAVLTKGGYKVRAVQPVDMFPHTHHVETAVLMMRTNE